MELCVGNNKAAGGHELLLACVQAARHVRASHQGAGAGLPSAGRPGKCAGCCGLRRRAAQLPASHCRAGWSCPLAAWVMGQSSNAATCSLRGVRSLLFGRMWRGMASSAASTGSSQAQRWRHSTAICYQDVHVPLKLARACTRCEVTRGMPAAGAAGNCVGNGHAQAATCHGRTWRPCQRRGCCCPLSKSSAGNQPSLFPASPDTLAPSRLMHS